MGAWVGGGMRDGCCVSTEGLHAYICMLTRFRVCVGGGGGGGGGGCGGGVFA